MLLSKQVIKMEMEDNKVRGVLLNDERTISAKYFISNIDAQQTFCRLLKIESLNSNFIKRLNQMQASLSMFIVYLGIKEISHLPQIGSNNWYLPFYDVDKMYYGAQKRSLKHLAEFMIHIYSKNSASVFINANFGTKQYWNSLREKVSEELINQAEKIIPGLSKNIVFKQSVTPYGLYTMTLNQRGASYGWEGTPSQMATEGLSLKTFIKNLFLTGHWTTLAQGVGGVVYLGRETAKLILRKQKVDIC